MRSREQNQKYRESMKQRRMEKRAAHEQKYGDELKQIKKEQAELKKRYQKIMSRKRYDDNAEEMQRKAREKNEQERKFLEQKMREEYEKTPEQDRKEYFSEYYRKMMKNPEWRLKKKKWREENRERIRAVKKAYRQSEQGQRKRREYTITRYGITVEEYDKYVEQQQGKCAICGRVPDAKTKFNTLCIDHDHKTNKFRGLLCHHCNTGIGSFLEDVEALKKAIVYLESKPL